MERSWWKLTHSKLLSQLFRSKFTEVKHQIQLIANQPKPRLLPASFDYLSQPIHQGSLTEYLTLIFHNSTTKILVLGLLNTFNVFDFFAQSWFLLYQGQLEHRSWENFTATVLHFKQAGRDDVIAPFHKLHQTLIAKEYQECFEFLQPLVLS